jgi:DUF971 family protein
MASGERTRVRRVLLVGDQVVVVWGDGHESYYPGQALRGACSCAACKGEQHLFGRATLPTLTPLRPEASVPVATRPVGNYGLQVTWGDGHDHGIYALDALRASCPCEACRATRASG